MLSHDPDLYITKVTFKKCLGASLAQRGINLLHLPLVVFRDGRLLALTIGRCSVKVQSQTIVILARAF